jgi:Uncharacterized conserved protein (DUF2278)
MSRKFTRLRPTVGASLPREVFGRLVGQFESSSHTPRRSDRENARHIYLDVKVPGGQYAGIYECAVNVESDDRTEVLYCERMEDLSSGGVPTDGFDEAVRLSYGSGDGPDDMGLTDSDFHTIDHAELYNRLADLAQECDRIAAYGVTYSDGTGIHDIHMRSGTESRGQVSSEYANQDGAIAFYFDLEAAGEKKSYATWVFIKFDNQTIVND